MKSPMRNLFMVASGLLIGFGISLGGAVLADRQQVETSLPLEELQGLVEAYERVKESYVKEVDDRELLEHALRGMLSGLDPHSAYLNEEDFKELQVGTTGEFGGLGIEVNMEDGFVKVVSPIDDTPAQRAGVKAGDLIIRLDDVSVKGMSLNDAVKIMRGTPGTTIRLTIVREGVDQPIDIEIERAIIRVRSVKSRMLAPGYGYLRITSFQSATGKQLEAAIDSLRDEAEGGLKGMILDLRNNPGGVLNAAVDVSDAFLRDGVIVYTEGRAAEDQMRFTAKPDDLIEGLPLVVLINGGSASASEIVAGALQDHGRAVIMGSSSFGKGSVQTIYPLTNDTAIKITTALYFTPAGRSIQAEGIVPDVEIEDLRLAQGEEKGFTPLKEADLTGHLANGNGRKEAEQDANGEVQEESLAARDYALYEALNLLKGLYILQAR